MYMFPLSPSLIVTQVNGIELFFVSELSTQGYTRNQPAEVHLSQTRRLRILRLSSFGQGALQMLTTHTNRLLRTLSTQRVSATHARMLYLCCPSGQLQCFTQLHCALQETTAVMELAILCYEVPQVFKTMPLRSLRALLAVSKQLRQVIRHQASFLAISKHKALVVSTASHWQSVQHVHLHSMCLSATEMWSFSQHCWPNLTALDFTSAHLDTGAMVMLARGKWPLLQHLNLCGQQLPPAVMAFLRLSEWPMLRFLSLEACRLHERTIIQLVKAKWPALESLSLAQNALTAAGLAELSKGNWLQLSKLDLRQTSIGPQALAHLANGNWPRMTSILLSQTQISACGQLLQRASWFCLAHLSLHDCNLTSHDMKQLCCHNWPELQDLDLSANRLDCAAFSYLSQGMWPLLVSLNLSNTGVSSAAMSDLIHAQWPKIADLDLSKNSCTIDSAAIAVLVKARAQTPELGSKLSWTSGDFTAGQRQLATPFVIKYQ